MNLSQILIHWYEENKRDLPWRRTSDPYKIWVSEIILQQTRVNQGKDYYLRFLDEFPDVQTLAAAPEEKVLKVWQGLGYYSRARNLHYTSIEIANRHQSVFPDTYDEIIKLKGIGKYTAAAIASFAFNLPYPVLDGNVIRVITRLFSISGPIEKNTTKKEIDQALQLVFDTKKPGLFNQAIMEFGALHCIPKNPACNSCLLNAHCLAFQKNKVNHIPKKGMKSKPRDRFFNYLIIQVNDTLLLNKRTGNDIWKNLYDFPLMEATSKLNDAKLVCSPEWSAIFQNTPYRIDSISGLYLHKLSHQNLHIRFIHISVLRYPPAYAAKYRVVKRSDIRNYPVPIVIEKYIESSFSS